MNITKQIQWYAENAEIRKKEKTENGEVFTPISIVREMLACIPRSFWSRPDVKVLDPAAGWGQFSTVAYSLFMRGLKEWEPDEERRAEHILKSILQQVELNPSSVKTLRSIFGPEANIIRGDFLKNRTKEQLPEKFDLIMGNPPQNSGGIKAKNTEANHEHGGETIWPKFVEHSVELLRGEGSFLTFIHPAPWQNDVTTTGEGTQGALVNDMDIVRTKQFNIRRTKDVMDVEIPVAWYLARPRTSRLKTRVWDWCDNKWRLWDYRKQGFVPTEAVALHEKLMALVERAGGTMGDLIEGAGGAVDIVDSSQLPHPRPLFPVINVVRGEIVVEHTTENHNERRGIVGRPKLIFANATMGYPVLDIGGEQWSAKGDTQIMVDDDVRRLRRVQEFFQSDVFLQLAEISRVRQKFLNRKIFHRIPDIMKLSDVEIGDLVRDVCVRKWAEGGGEGRLAPGVVRGLKRWGSRRRHRTYSSRRKRARGRKTRRRVRMR